MNEIVIKGMEMPEGCYSCPILIGKAHCSCAITGTQIRIEKVREELEDERMPDCPLVELPPHGRLIDADSLKKTLSAVSGEQRQWFYAEVGQVIDEAPTVLEANYRQVDSK